MRSSLLIFACLLSCTPPKSASTVTSSDIVICYDSDFKPLEALDILSAIHDWQLATHYHIPLRASEVDGGNERSWAHCYVTILRVLSTMTAWQNVDKSATERVLAIHEQPHIWVLADRVAWFGDMRTVVAHELGHAFGLREGEGLMSVVLNPGAKPNCSHAVEAAFYLGGKK
jgi:hypothetical protein